MWKKLTQILGTMDGELLRHKVVSYLVMYSGRLCAGIQFVGEKCGSIKASFVWEFYDTEPRAGD